MAPSRVPAASVATAGRARSATLVLVLVTATLLAGCSAPGGVTGTPTATVTESAPLADAGVDADAVWNRTVDLLDANATQPSIHVRNMDSGGDFRIPSVVSVYTGARPNGSAPSAAAYYRSSDNSVVVAEETVANTSSRRLEVILAHEYVHAIQSQDERFARDADDPRPHDRLVLTAQREGMARYVETVYVRRYLNDTIERDLDQRFDNATTIERWVVAPYFYGLQYYERTAASPSALPEVAATPPASTEDLLHRNPPDGAPLAVNASDLGPWHVDQDGATWGEAATRVVLRDELNETRSVAAAAGWANDSYYALGRDEGNATGYVWTHRWDSPAEAAEFATAMEDFLDRRRTETERYRFRVERLAPETTAVIAGRGGFVGNATVTADGNASVAVSVSS